MYFAKTKKKRDEKQAIRARNEEDRLKRDPRSRPGIAKVATANDQICDRNHLRSWP